MNRRDQENPTMLLMIERFLRFSGYDGLYWNDGDDSCGCTVEDLAPCGPSLFSSGLSTCHSSRAPSYLIFSMSSGI